MLLVWSSYPLAAGMGGKTVILSRPRRKPIKRETEKPFEFPWEEVKVDYSHIIMDDDEVLLQ